MLFGVVRGLVGGGNWRIHAAASNGIIRLRNIIRIFRNFNAFFAATHRHANISTFNGIPCFKWFGYGVGTGTGAGAGTGTSGCDAPFLRRGGRDGVCICL